MLVRRDYQRLISHLHSLSPILLLIISSDLADSLGKWSKFKGRGDSSPPPAPPFVSHFSIRKSWKKERVWEGVVQLSV